MLQQVIVRLCRHMIYFTFFFFVRYSFSLSLCFRSLVHVFHSIFSFSSCKARQAMYAECMNTCVCEGAWHYWYKYTEFLQITKWRTKKKKQRKNSLLHEDFPLQNAFNALRCFSDKREQETEKVTNIYQHRHLQCELQAHTHAHIRTCSFNQNTQVPAQFMYIWVRAKLIVSSSPSMLLSCLSLARFSLRLQNFLQSTRTWEAKESQCIFVLLEFISHLNAHMRLVHVFINQELASITCHEH